MVDIQENILQKLKCGECDCYLSCAPVYLKTDGVSVCGRCPLPEEKNILVARNSPYEELAALVAFPCRYQKHGCHKKSPIKEINEHEEKCEFRPLICPVVENCDWIGPENQRLRHCEAEHPEQVLSHPCTLKHDFTTDNTKNYLMTVFHVLFLIQTKVSLATKRIYHIVRLLSDEEHTSLYNYEMEINTNGIEMKKNGVVASQNSSTLDKYGESNGLGIPTKFEPTTFKITVSASQETIKCGICGQDSKPAYREIEKGLCCATCAPPLKSCENAGNKNGCPYKDITSKIDKHCQYYCPYTKNCQICRMDIAIPLEKHYMREHSDITHGTNNLWRTIANVNWKYRIITSDIGALICWYCLSSQFTIGVRSPLRSKQLSEYSCELRLTHPVNGRSIHRTLDVVYDDWVDWRIDIPNNDLKQVFAGKLCGIVIQLIKKLPLTVQCSSMETEVN